MWEEIFQIALSNGVWSALFIGLLVYQLKDSSKREKKYQDTITKLNHHLDMVESIKEEVKEIRVAIINNKKGGGDEKQ